MRRIVRILVVLALFATMVGATSQPVFADGTFVDDDGSVFEADIEWLAAEGITKGCNPPTNDRFCPDANVTRGQMAAFLVRAFGYTDDGGGNLFVDDDASIFEADIDRLGTAGVTKGCNPPVNDRFCPDANVTRGQMAAFLVRAFGYTDDGGGNLFVDDDDSIFEADIDRLGTAGVTKGCNPPTNDKYCPDDYVTRGQMAAFLHRAFTATPVPDPLVITTGSLPDGDVGTPYTAALTATGGVTPYTWTLTTGTLPDGLTLNTGGTITGTPTTHADVTLTIQAKDAASVTVTKTLGLSIDPAPLVITTTSLSDGDVGTPYSAALAATGGVTPYTWTITAGALPAGLTLNPDGTITGTPTTKELRAFTIQAVDSVTVAASKALSIDVAIIDDICVQSHIPQIECAALVDLYNSTTGTAWAMDTGWLVDDNPCDWHGVDCLAGHVSTVILACNDLAGPIPASLGNLNTLISLDLSYNELTGPIPAELGNLTALQHLYIRDSGLTGPIPAELGDLGALLHLYVNTNGLTGPIPAELGNLSTLTGLILADNELTGPIPVELGNLSTLLRLYLSQNGLTGPIPAELGKLTALQHLYLNDNGLSGPVPDELRTGTAISLLRLYGQTECLTASSLPLAAWLAGFDPLWNDGCAP